MLRLAAMELLAMMLAVADGAAVPPLNGSLTVDGGSVFNATAGSLVASDGNFSNATEVGSLVDIGSNSSNATLARKAAAVVAAGKRHWLYCLKYPAFCQLGCSLSPPSPDEIAAWQGDEPFKQAILGVGKPNMRIWCMNASKLSLHQDCVVGQNMAKYGEVARRHYAEVGMRDFEVSYCFLGGHCDSSNVTNSTTRDEAASICDARFGKGKWLKTMKNYVRMFTEETTVKMNRFESKKSASLYAKLKCAVGSYHCDAIWCKETVCSDPRYIDQYRSHF